MGPLGATVEDVAAGYVKIAGPDESDEWTKKQPEIHLQGFYESRLEGIRLGWFPDWFHHSKPEVANAVKNMFPVLREAGATLNEISIPKLDAVHLSLIITIITEMRSSLESFSEQW